MKKIIMLVLIGCLVFTLAACTVLERDSDLKEADDTIVLDDRNNYGDEFIEYIEEFELKQGGNAAPAEYVFDGMWYFEKIEKKSECKLNGDQVKELNNIFEKYTWEAAEVPPIGFEANIYSITKNSQTVAFFVEYEGKTLIGTKDADGATDGIYLAPIGLFQDIANFYSANL